MKGIFVINSLSGGGAEKVFSKLTYMIDRDELKSYSVEVVILDDEQDVYQLPSSITVHRIGNKLGIFGQLFRFMSLVRKQRPEFMVSFLFRSNCFNVIGAKLFNYTSMLSERGNTNARLKGKFIWLKKLIIKTVFNSSDITICVSKGVADCLNRDYAVPQEKLTVLNNSYDLAEIRRKSKNENNAQLKPGYVLAIGRLVKLKGFDDLISSFAKSSINRDLVILGDGDELEYLKLHAKKEGVEERVKFLGFVSNPYPVMKNAYMFVLSSHFEGFPNAMVEAMSLGVPVISTLTDGPLDILQPNNNVEEHEFNKARYGIVHNIEDRVALTRALDELESNQALYKELSELSQERAAHYSEDKFYSEFSSIVAERVPGSV